MADEPKTMTWTDLAAWINTLTPEQQSMAVIVFNTETCDFASVSMAFLASKDDVGQPIYGWRPTSEVLEGQLILKID